MTKGLRRESEHISKKFAKLRKITLKCSVKLKTIAILFANIRNDLLYTTRGISTQESDSEKNTTIVLHYKIFSSSILQGPLSTFLFQTQKMIDILVI